MSQENSIEEYVSATNLPQGHVFLEPDMKPYRDGFRDAAAKAYASFEQKCRQAIVKQKFQLRSNQEWKRNSFIQSAAELMVGAFYSQSGATSLEPDAKVGGTSKDVDWRITLSDLHLNIEVKCSVEDAPATDKSNRLAIKSLGRLPKHAREFDKVSKAFAEVGYTSQMPKHADNRMKDFLISAHEKFGNDRALSDLNILIVCCGTPPNMNEWRHYLLGRQGLFTPNSFCDRNKYINVDVVILSSARYLHDNAVARSANSWRLENTLNLAFINPMKARPVSSDSYAVFLDSFPNYTRQYNEYIPTYGAGTPIAEQVKMYHFPIEMLDNKARSRIWPGYEFSSPDPNDRF